MSDDKSPAIGSPLEISVDVDLARRLVAQQFPQWADLSMEPIANQGWDNRTFRLGNAMSIRLPSARDYAEQVQKEQLWLPKLAPYLPVAIPRTLAMGKPGLSYPWHWSIYRWIEGDVASAESITDSCQLAYDLGSFLVALQQIDASEGPAAGAHNFHRGGSLAIYDSQMQQAIARLQDKMHVTAVRTMWTEALSSVWQQAPVWVHGDVAVGNMLLDHGRLCGVIDFGCCAVGDPASDLVVAWTLFSGKSRELFRSILPYDDLTWRRARGWALWKTLILHTGIINGPS